MKIISNSVTEINERDPFKKIELVGRTCYKSESNITKDSAKKFVSRLIKSKHLAMTEHAVFTFCLPSYLLEADYANRVNINRFMTISKLTEEESKPCLEHSSIIVSANLRSIIESYGLLKSAMINILNESYPELVEIISEGITSSDNCCGYMINDVSMIPESARSAHSFKTFRFITDRGVSHELVRHRDASFGQESTRYCLYSSDKFGNELTFIRPSTWNLMNSKAQTVLTNSFRDAESAYMELVANGLNAQQARAVLPNSIKTEIVVTASEQEWHHIGDLRYRGTTGAPHPDMRDLMSKLHEIYPEL